MCQTILKPKHLETAVMLLCAAETIAPLAGTELVIHWKLGKVERENYRPLFLAGIYLFTFTG